MKKRKRTLKKWLRITLNGITTVTLLICLLALNNNLEKDFMNDCESLGYSHNYCILHK